MRLATNPWFIVAAAVLILASNVGIRQTTGLMLPEISLSLDEPVSNLALGFGVQNLLWGAIAPFAGMFAERYGTVRVLQCGGLLYLVGMLLAAFAESSWVFFIANAILVGIGVGATTFPIVLAAVSRKFPASRRTFALGVTSAGGSLGQFLYAVLLGWVDPIFDWSTIFQIFALTLVSIFGLSFFLKEDVEPETAKTSVFDLKSIGDAFKYREYVLLNLGFFVCGFHIALLTVHMAGVVNYCGLPPEVAANSLAVIGLANVVGVIAAGWAGDRWHKPWLLTLIYWLRACLIMCLLAIPPDTQLFYLFSVAMGMLWLSTVPLTSGAVVQMFGTKNLASLFGIVMFSHQIGAFCGSWWSGIIFDQSGSYEWALILSAALGLFAAAVHLPITPSKMSRFQTA
ncbi:MFS transporter [Neptuniibacter sp.]|uniref:MFS transporter n=1 Tax=Neptuniibacter sp. TaxID=1962643 RepID=UPI003B5AEB1B